MNTTKYSVQGITRFILALALVFGLVAFPIQVQAAVDDIVVTGFVSGSTPDKVKVNFDLTADSAGFDLEFYQSTVLLDTYSVGALAAGSYQLDLALGVDIDLVAADNDTDYYLTVVANPAAGDVDNTATFVGFYQYPGALVFVHGSDAADTITVAADATLTLNGVPTLLSGVTGFRIRGHAGDDVINTRLWGAGPVGQFGGPGSDTLYAGAGDDFFLPGAGADAIQANVGVDKVSFEDFMYTVPGFTAGFIVKLTSGIITAPLHDGSGTETKTILSVEDVVGSMYDDTIVGNNEVGNRIWGLGGNDLLDGRNGDDILWGGGGNDTVKPWAGNDIAYGGDGIDTLSYENYTAAVNIDLRSGVTGWNTNDIFPNVDFENATGTAYDDFIYGSTGPNLLIGYAGQDSINGDDGSDTIYGGAGDDALNGGNDNDTIYGEGGNDAINGGTNNDVLYGGTGMDTLQGGDGSDYIYGEGSNDVMWAYFNWTCALDVDHDFDYLDGGNGVDTAHGLLPQDTLIAETINGLCGGN